MTTIPPREDRIAAAIDAAIEAQAGPPRPHLGCSQLGHHCDRHIWLGFRWALPRNTPGRVLRLFRRGQREEETVVADLIAAGLDVRNTGGDQLRVTFGGHVSGSIDGVIESGVPDTPKKRHILECKTHSRKSFDELIKEGVRKAHAMHYMQCQLYMHGSRIDRALYVAVCKDDDRIYTERVRYDAGDAEKLVARGHRIAVSDRMPEPTAGASPDWYLCKMCDYHAFCHGGERSRMVNCRTCAHSTAESDGDWSCARHQAKGIPVEFQRAGCSGHVMHPDLVPWKLMDSGHKDIALYEHNGWLFSNGEPDANVYSSRELAEDFDACRKRGEDDDIPF